MSVRSNPLPIHKAPSSENVCKFKEDRVRNNGNSYKSKQRITNGNNSKYMTSNSSQFRNGRQLNGYQKQLRSKNEWVGKRSKFPSEHREEVKTKKGNLNHLLNFTFEHHEEPFQTPCKFPSRKKIVKDSFYNKEQFIQANCQLLLKQDGKYEEQFDNLDMPVNWDCVEKMNLWREELPTCPICLSDFCAAQVTKCGHIYCWPCILHYLALDDKTWRKCPVCNEAVHRKDLRSVSVHKEKSFKVQNLITMRLMKRRKDSMVTLPAEKEFPNLDTQYRFDNSLTFSEQRIKKYLVASPQQVLESVLQAEKSQLQFKLATELNTFEQTFIKSALDLCNERESLLVQQIKNSESNTFQNDTKLGNARTLDFEQPSVQIASVSDKELMFEMESCDDNDRKAENEEKDGNCFYFYQAVDGQHTYLHPLNSRCILHQYGSYAACPPEITAKILETDEFIMNERTRKRHRNLGHLPLSLEFRIVELDLRPPLVSADTLTSFQEALDYRAGMRKKKAREEKKILRKSQNAAMRKQGKYPEARICLENFQQFPQIPSSNSAGSSFSVLFPSPGTTPCDEPLIPSSSAVGFSPEESVASSSSESSMSFAQMLKTSTSDHSAWTRRAPVSRPLPHHALDSDDDDDLFSAPSYQTSFGDALSSAFENLETPSGGNAKKGKKKNKKKKVVLFST